MLHRLPLYVTLDVQWFWKIGLYKNYCRYRDNCNYCIVDLEEEKQQEFEEKNNAIKQGFEALNNGDIKILNKHVHFSSQTEILSRHG